MYHYLTSNIDRIRYEVGLGIVPVSVLRHWEIYSKYDAYKKMGFGVCDAVLNASNDMRCSESTVFKVIKEMETKL
jgi:hypothetical protein